MARRIAAPVRWIVVLILVASCDDSELDIRLEGEGIPFGDIDQWKDMPLGAGLTAKISVVRVSWGPRGGEPSFQSYTDDQLSFRVRGGTLLPCEGGTCVTATSDEVTLYADTPDGEASRTWSVYSDLKLSAFTPNSSHDTVDALHIEVGVATDLRPVFVSDRYGEVAGHAELAAAGPLTLESSLVIASVTGSGTIGAPSLPAAPALRIRAVTREESLASIAAFKSDRWWATTIDLATEDTPTSNSVVFQGFDAGGALALYGLPINASGPALTPANADGRTCATGNACFLNPRLPDGVNELSTQLQLTAGAAVQIIPVHITRAVPADD